MLLPHPVTLRALVEEYEALAARQATDATDGTGEAGRQAQDLAYTLCVSTGTRDVEAALATARRLLAATADEEAHGPRAVTVSGPRAGVIPAASVALTG
ncbi:DUF5133 domain-containing protein [Streptomyces sp. NPDC008313]|uniref:DUF5133 domain-containing protein n=1 Tax=Streptomyces sp. NPDC008313 TaxID=3364826 RepID=UPI0036E159BA